MDSSHFSQSPELPASGCPPSQPSRREHRGRSACVGPDVLSEKQAGCRGPGPGEEVQRAKGGPQVHRPHLGQARPGMQSLSDNPVVSS